MVYVVPENKPVLTAKVSRPVVTASAIEPTSVAVMAYLGRSTAL